MTSPRIAVFIDWQNTYHGARDAFGSPDDPPLVGQVDPMRLARHLVASRPGPDGELVSVQVFRGAPNKDRSPELAATYKAQLARWAVLYWPTLDVFSIPVYHLPTSVDVDGRPLAWDRGHEKGVDTAMAIRMALGAERRRFDVAIAVTADMDIAPALDAVFSAGLVAETATWDNPERAGRIAKPIRSSHYPTVVRRLGIEVFEAVSDRPAELAAAV